MAAFINCAQYVAGYAMLAVGVYGAAGPDWMLAACGAALFIDAGMWSAAKAVRR